jgi:hypothetical protein
MRRAYVPDGSIDVGSLEGDALTRWYVRSPAEIEQERQAAAAKRYQDFYGPSGTDPDPGFSREIPSVDNDPNPDFGVSLPSTSRDIDPGFTWVQAGPNRFRGVRLTSDDQSSGPLSLAPMSYGGAASPGDPSTSARSQEASPLEVSGSELDLTPQPVPQLDGQLIGPPTTGEAAPAAGRAVANFADREAWQRGAQKAAQALSDAEKNALRAAARARLARANGISTSEMQAEVHHSDPLSGRI